MHRYQLEDKSWAIISCWRPNREELQEIIRTGQIWVNTCGETLAPFSLHGENPFMDCQGRHWDPVVGMTIDQAVDHAIGFANDECMPVNFFFNGITMRVYPGVKVPAEVYVNYYKAKTAADYFLNIIHKANGKPIPEIGR